MVDTWPIAFCCAPTNVMLEPVRPIEPRIAPDPLDSKAETVVFLMSADPKPRDDVAFAQTRRSIMFADANGEGAKIAQRFNAGQTDLQYAKSRQGRQNASSE